MAREVIALSNAETVRYAGGSVRWFKLRADTSVYVAEMKIASICGGKQAYQRRFGGKISRKRGRRSVYRRRVV